MNLKFRAGLTAILGIGLWSGWAAAQMFGEETPAAVPDKTETQVQPQTGRVSGWNNRDRLGGNWWGIRTTPKQQAAKPATVPVQQQTKPPAKEVVENPKDYLYKSLPQVKRPTLDGVKRGTTIIRPIMYDGNPLPKEETLIFLYYSDFTVNRMMSGTVTCDVRFQILTTLDRSLNNLSVRLRWPNMETALSFSDIPPNQSVHYDYTLLGDGCYSMDRIPNIIVNRCRVKGLSQQDCAAKIRWLRK